MPLLTFPTLPGIDVQVERAPYYATKVLESVSGKEVRASFRASSRVRYRLRFNFARTATAAPSPFEAYSEMGVLLHFLDTHLGSSLPFTFTDPYTGSGVTVRLVEDSVKMVQIVPGAWAVESLEMVSVL